MLAYQRLKRFFFPTTIPPTRAHAIRARFAPCSPSSPRNDAIFSFLVAAAPLLIVIAGVRSIVEDPDLKRALQQQPLLAAPASGASGGADAAAAPAVPKFRSTTGAAVAVLESRLEELEARLRAATAAAAAPPPPPLPPTPQPPQPPLPPTAAHAPPA